MSTVVAREALFLNPDEAARSLGVCRKTLWSHTVPRGSIPCVRLGRSVRYSVDALRKWAAENAEQPAETPGAAD